MARRNRNRRGNAHPNNTRDRDDDYTMHDVDAPSPKNWHSPYNNNRGGGGGGGGRKRGGGKNRHAKSVPYIPNGAVQNPFNPFNPFERLTNNRSAPPYGHTFADGPGAHTQKPNRRNKPRAHHRKSHNRRGSASSDASIDSFDSDHPYPHYSHSHAHHSHNHHPHAHLLSDLLPFPPLSSSLGGAGSSAVRFCTECRDVRRANLRFRNWAVRELQRCGERVLAWSEEVGVGFAAADEMDWQPEPVTRVLVLAPEPAPASTPVPVPPLSASQARGGDDGGGGGGGAGAGVSGYGTSVFGGGGGGAGAASAPAPAPSPVPAGGGGGMGPAWRSMPVPGPVPGSGSGMGGYGGGGAAGARWILPTGAWGISGGEVSPGATTAEVGGGGQLHAGMWQHYQPSPENAKVMTSPEIPDYADGYQI
ncbi:hypothetical protein F5B20DRAFT_172542 [Whalleya microplaca]|nr:hypothetical protein F5B20DRAFT_172542 [Whalleya microplaca]